MECEAKRVVMARQVRPVLAKPDVGLGATYRRRLADQERERRFHQGPENRLLQPEAGYMAASVPYLSIPITLSLLRRAAPYMADYRVDFFHRHDPRIDLDPRPSTTVESRATMLLPAADRDASRQTHRGWDGAETANKSRTVAAGAIIDNR